jgi:glycosyltransferase involved in cell wall biosynthesis
VDSSLPEISLDVYGVGPEESRLKKMAVRYGESIKFHPPVPIEEVRNLMHKHDVYVLSSNPYEGWGAVVSEALEENMKVVGTYEAGASATILPESNLYPAGDWMKLADILVSDVEKTGIGEWTAESAARALLPLCEAKLTGDMQ